MREEVISVKCLEQSVVIVRAVEMDADKSPKLEIKRLALGCP